MTAYETRSHIGPDGRLVLSVPREFANTDVRVVVEPERNGHPAFPPGTRLPDRVLSANEWRDRLLKSAGSLPGLPDVERPGPNDYDNRGEW